MNRALAALALLLVPVVAEAQQKRVDPARFGWLTDYDAGIKEAKRTGKPMLLVFRCEP